MASTQEATEQYKTSPSFADRYDIVMPSGKKEVSDLERLAISDHEEFNNLRSLIEHANGRMYKGFFDDRQICCIVERSSSKIVGYGYITYKVQTYRYPSGETEFAPRFTHITVDPEHRRGRTRIGISDVIVEEILSVLKTNVLHVQPNDKSRKLFKRHGFEDCWFVKTPTR